MCEGAVTLLMSLIKNPGWTTLKGKGFAALALKNIGHHQRGVGKIACCLASSASSDTDFAAVSAIIPEKHSLPSILANYDRPAIA